MNQRTKQFRVGLVVFATILISSILILWNSDFSALPFRGEYQIMMLVDQAPGVAPGTPVRRHGLLIGRVAAVEDTEQGALITLSIDEGKQIRTNEIARIRTSLVGDAVIEIVKGRAGAFSTGTRQESQTEQPVSQEGVRSVSLLQAPPQASDVIPPGGRIPGMYVPSPMDAFGEVQADLKQTINALGAAGEEVAELADRLNTVLSQNDLRRVTQLLEDVDQAMIGFAEVTRNLNDIVGDEQFKAQLKEGITQLPALFADARAILQGLEVAVGSADENLKNLQGLTGPLGNRGPTIVANLESAVRNLEDLLGQVALLSRNINNSEGTLGLLIRERQLYDQLNATIAEARATITEVRCIVGDPEVDRRIKQILYNVWVFSDKIARDPARLARGIIDRETPIK